MIRARHTRMGRAVSECVSGPLMNRMFREVRIDGIQDRSGEPLLLIANHFSWWDGFIQYRLCRELLYRKLYVMMLEEQLRRYPMLVRCGCFSVRKHSRSVIESLDYASQLLHEKGNAVLVFPQGAIQSQHVERIRFESGIGYLLARAHADLRLGFNVNLVDWGSFCRPTLDIRYCGFPSSFSCGEEVEEAYNRFYEECRELQCKMP